MPTSTGSREVDLSESLAEQVRQANAGRQALRIVGGDTKAFYGRRVEGAPLRMAGHRGVVAYEPSELVVTARAGTPVVEIEALLAQHGQMLAFEPPVFAPAGTIGGAVAAGLSGPARPFAGAVRDFVLGVKMLDGQGRILRLGGTVFKNVAGFDAFRLQAGALGCLGVLLEVSLRLTPRPACELTLGFEDIWPAASVRLTGLMRRALPLTGACHDGGGLFLRLRGPRAAVEAAQRSLGGEAAAPEIWEALRHMSHPVLAAPRLWRLSVPREAQIAASQGSWLIDWAGAQRWLVSDEPAEAIRREAVRLGGHATLFRGAAAGEEVFTPLPAPMLQLHQRLKRAFDPAGVFNPGRMYEDL